MISWSDNFATGIAQVDNQHKMLFQMVEDFQAALDEGRGGRVYGTLLQSLARYATAHFRFEEQCMDKYHCPVAQKNKDAHTKFVDVVSGFQQRYAASGFDSVEAYTLVDTLEEWLVAHIISIDIHLKSCVQQS